MIIWTMIHLIWNIPNNITSLRLLQTFRPLFTLNFYIFLNHNFDSHNSQSINQYFIDIPAYQFLIKKSHIKNNKKNICLPHKTLIVAFRNDTYQFKCEIHTRHADKYARAWITQLLTTQRVPKIRARK